jgi:rhodanese-related sulfurtransferase
MRAKSRIWLAVGLGVVAVALIAVACGSDSEPETAGEVGETVQVDGGSYTNVTPQELQAMLGAKDFPLINVHIPYEGEIEPTDAFIQYDRIDEHLGELPSDTDAKIVLYCMSGNMSDIAARTLIELGYTDVWNLNGGMIAWEAAGYPLVYEQSRRSTGSAGLGDLERPRLEELARVDDLGRGERTRALDLAGGEARGKVGESFRREAVDVAALD